MNRPYLIRSVLLAVAIGVAGARVLAGPDEQVITGNEPCPAHFYCQDTWGDGIGNRVLIPSPTLIVAPIPAVPEPADWLLWVVGIVALIAFGIWRAAARLVRDLEEVEMTDALHGDESFAIYQGCSGNCSQGRKCDCAIQLSEMPGNFGTPRPYAQKPAKSPRWLGIGVVVVVIGWLVVCYLLGRYGAQALSGG